MGFGGGGGGGITLFVGVRLLLHGMLCHLVDSMSMDFGSGIAKWREGSRASAKK